MRIESIEAAIAVLTGEFSQPKKRDCQLCEGGKAVGKYFLDPSESDNHGWWRVCSHCAEMVSRVGVDVQYYKYSKEYHDQLDPKLSLPEHVLNCSHEWVKWSLVNEHDRKHDKLFDWMRCEKCRCYGKRFRLGQTVMEDLSIEIDLSCSR
jgi:hypothetical protein